MAKKTDCYVDTSALIAFLDRSDSHHPLFRRLFAEPPNLVSSALVIAEGHGWFLRRYDQQRAIQFLAFVHALADMVIVPFDIEAIAESGAVARKFSDQKLTLADAHGIGIMRSRRINMCWSTDRHLGLGGASLAL